MVTAAGTRQQPIFAMQQRTGYAAEVHDTGDACAYCW